MNRMNFTYAISSTPKVGNPLSGFWLLALAAIFVGAFLGIVIGP